jgi:hypothetical protein
MKFYQPLCIFSVLLISINTFVYAQEIRPLKELYKSGCVKFTKELIISDESLPPAIYFENPRYVSFHKNGELLVGDSGASHIKKFDASGKFLSTIGKKGQGPGDFYSIEIVEVTQDRMIVWEVLNRRISFLTLNGDFVKSLRFDRESGLPKKIRVLPDDEIVMELEKTHFQYEKFPQTVSIGHYSSEMEHIDTIYTKELTRSKLITEPRIADVGQPFLPDVYWDVTSEGKVVIGYSEKYEIEVHDPDKGKLFSFSHEYEPVKVSDKDKDTHFSNMRVATFSRDGTKTTKQGAPDYIVKNTNFPKVKAAFKGVIADSEGNILVFPYLEDRGSENNYFDAFDKSGKFINRVKIEGNRHHLYSKNPRIRGRHFWIIEKDEDGFFKIIQYRISG